MIFFYLFFISCFRLRRTDSKVKTIDEQTVANPEDLVDFQQTFPTVHNKRPNTFGDTDQQENPNSSKGSDDHENCNTFGCSVCIVENIRGALV